MARSVTAAAEQNSELPESRFRKDRSLLHELRKQNYERLARKWKSRSGR